MQTEKRPLGSSGEDLAVLPGANSHRETPKSEGSPTQNQFMYFHYEATGYLSSSEDDEPEPQKFPQVIKPASRRGSPQMASLVPLGNDEASEKPRSTSPEATPRKVAGDSEGRKISEFVSSPLPLHDFEQSRRRLNDDADDEPPLMAVVGKFKSNAVRYSSMKSKFKPGDEASRRSALDEEEMSDHASSRSASGGARRGELGEENSRILDNDEAHRNGLRSNHLRKGQGPNGGNRGQTSTAKPQIFLEMQHEDPRSMELCHPEGKENFIDHYLLDSAVILDISADGYDDISDMDLVSCHESQVRCKSRRCICCNEDLKLRYIRKSLSPPTQPRPTTAYGHISPLPRHRDPLKLKQQQEEETQLRLALGDAAPSRSVSKATTPPPETQSRTPSKYRRSGRSPVPKAPGSDQDSTAGSIHLFHPKVSVMSELLDRQHSAKGSYPTPAGAPSPSPTQDTEPPQSSGRRTPSGGSGTPRWMLLYQEGKRYQERQQQRIQQHEIAEKAMEEKELQQCVGYGKKRDDAVFDRMYGRAMMNMPEGGRTVPEPFELSGNRCCGHSPRSQMQPSPRTNADRHIGPVYEDVNGNPLSVTERVSSTPTAAQVNRLEAQRREREQPSTALRSTPKHASTPKRTSAVIGKPAADLKATATSAGEVSRPTASAQPHRRVPNSTPRATTPVASRTAGSSTPRRSHGAVDSAAIVTPRNRPSAPSQPASAQKSSISSSSAARGR